jgi:hypothetical protein
VNLLDAAHKRAALVWLGLGALAVAGAGIARSLPSGIYPEVDFPRIVVVARQGDTPAAEVQRAVVRPLENALATVLGVERIRSRTIRGATEIGLQFAPGTDMWRALQLTESRIGEARVDLPADAEIFVERLNTTSFPIVTFNLAGHIDPRRLRELGEFVLRPALSRVSGVGRLAGGRSGASAGAGSRDGSPRARLISAERISRWFLPISGDYTLGGRYQLEGNAGGEILECDRPHLIRVSWVMGEMAAAGPDSEVVVRLTPAGAVLLRESILLFDQLEEYYPEGVKEFKLMVEKNKIDIPRHITKGLSDDQFDTMINVSLGMKPLWENALGADWEKKMTREKLRALFEQL